MKYGLAAAAVGSVAAVPVYGAAGKRPRPNFLFILADDVKYAPVKKRLKAELERWMVGQKDPGAAMDVPLPPKPKRKAPKKKV